MMTLDGREIVARQPAVAPHPHPRFKGELVPFRNLNTVILADETELFECDHCGYVNGNPSSVTSHMTVHNPDRVGTRYPPALLKAVAKAVAVAKRAGGRDVMTRAAADLNNQGLTMLKGQAWNNHNVSHVFNLYCKNIKVRVPQRKPPTVDGEPLPQEERRRRGTRVQFTDEQLPQSERRRREQLEPAPWSSDNVPVVLPDGPITVGGLTSALQNLHSALQEAAYQTRVVMAGLHRLEPNDPDPTLVEKAKRWDEYVKTMKKLLGE